MGKSDDKLLTICGRHRGNDKKHKKDERMLEGNNGLREKMEMHLQQLQIQNSLTREEQGTKRDFSLGARSFGTSIVLQISRPGDTEEHELETVQRKGPKQGSKDHNSHQGTVLKEQQDHDTNDVTTMEHTG